MHVLDSLPIAVSRVLLDRLDHFNLSNRLDLSNLSNHFNHFNRLNHFNLKS